MKNVNALGLIALFLGGIGTGIGSIFLYQWATGGLVGPEGLQGSPGGPEPQQLSGIYEGDHIWESAVVLDNATVVLRNGKFYGSNLYVYGNLTVENAELYLSLWPMGNAIVLLNDNQYYAPDFETYVMNIADNASVTFLKRYRSLNPLGGIICLILRNTSRLYIKNISIALEQTYIIPQEQSEVHVENVTFLPGDLCAYDSATVYLKNAFVARIKTYDNAIINAWTTTFDIALEADDFSSVLISNYSFIPEVKLWRYAVATVRVNTTITTLEAHDDSTTYFYQSEGCAIITQNLYDAAEVITL